MSKMVSIVVLALLASSCASTKTARGPFLKAKQMEHKSEAKASFTEKNQHAPKTKAMNASVQHNVKPSANADAAVQKANEGAKTNPNTEGFFNSNMVFDWEPNLLYQIYASPLRVTDISFEPMEKVLSVSGGDTTRWQVVQSTSGSGINEVKHVLIKPFKPNIQTNIIVMTDRRTYHLEVHSLLDGNYMAGVSWNYPSPMLILDNAALRDEEVESDPLGTLSPAELDFGYHFVAKNKPSWMPVRVFDDGRKTFIEFPKSARSREMPGLFVLSHNGDAEIVNYRVVGDFYIVDRLLDVVELRLGSVAPEVVGIERL